MYFIIRFLFIIGTIQNTKKSKLKKINKRKLKKINKT